MSMFIRQTISCPLPKLEPHETFLYFSSCLCVFACLFICFSHILVYVRVCVSCLQSTLIALQQCSSFCALVFIRNALSKRRNIFHRCISQSRLGNRYIIHNWAINVLSSAAPSLLFLVVHESLLIFIYPYSVVFINHYPVSSRSF